MRDDLSNGRDLGVDWSNKQRHLNTWVASVSVFLVSLQPFSVGPDVMPRHVIGVLLLPLWIPALKRWSGGRSLAFFGTFAAISGIATAWISSANHEFSSSTMLRTLVLLFGIISGIGIVLWARIMLTDRAIGLLFALGFFVNISAGTGALGDSNSLKFIFALPVAIAVLSAMPERRLGLQLVALVALAGLTAVADARSMFGMCLASGAFVAWQLRPARDTARTPSWIMTAALLTVVALGIYNIGTELFVEGYLGTAAQERSVAQINASGSLILGGRPEIAAFAALFVLRPWGFGPGISVNFGELLTAKNGLASIGYDPNNGYIARYMFGDGGIELHSVLGDLWAAFGIGGLCLGLLITGLIVKSVSVRISRREATALVLFLACMALWSMLFGPAYSAARTLILAIGLLLVPRAGGVEPVQYSPRQNSNPPEYRHERSDPSPYYRIGKGGDE